MRLNVHLSSRLSCTFLALSIALTPAAGLAQAPAPGGISPPPPVESAPLAPPPASPPAAAPPAAPAPAPSTAEPAPPAAPVSPPAVATPAPAPAPTNPTPSAPAVAGRPTLLPNPGDPVNVDEAVLPGKPAAILSGTSTWDEGFTSLKNAFRKIEEELTRAGIAPAGRPLTVFLQTDDLGFRYDAMVPVPPGLEPRPLSPEVRLGKTPEGKALRFVHKEAYDQIDETYETITAYLDAKNITVKDTFIEEYVTDLTDSTDANLEINVFVQPKE